MTSVQQARQIISMIMLCMIIGLAWKVIPHPVIPLVFGILPFGILFVLNSSFFIILMFVLFSFFRIHEAFPALMPLKIPLLLALSSLSVIAWHFGFTRSMEAYWTKELTIFSIFFALVTVGVFAASNKGLAIGYYTGTYIKIGIMVMAIAWLTRAPKDFALASKLIVITGVAIGLVAIDRKNKGIGLVEGTRVTIGRDYGSLLGDPNDLSLVLMFPIAFAVSLIVTKNVGIVAKIIGIIGVPVLIQAVLATQSRGGLLGIMAVFGIIGYRMIKSKILFFGIGGIAAMGLFVAAGITDRSSGGAAEEGAVDASAMGRIYAWQAAWGMAVTNPLTGVGINNFLSNYFMYSPHWDGLNHAVHSTWFGVLAETGFLGFIVFMTLIIKLTMTSFRTLNKIEANMHLNPPASIHSTSRAVLAGLLATCTSGTFLTQGFTWPIYILTSLVVAVSYWVDQNIPDPDPDNKTKYHYKKRENNESD